MIVTFGEEEVTVLRDGGGQSCQYISYIEGWDRIIHFYYPYLKCTSIFYILLHVEWIVG